MELLEKLIEDMPRPIRVLDIGGTNSFWEMRGWAGREDIRVTTVNLKAEEKRHENIEPRSGDATNLREYADRSFDIAFSNSVIEHLFTIENQHKMAAEILRVGKSHWVQTPSYWFPIEPHFHVLGWQWMPKSVRVALLRRRRCGWRGPVADASEARRHVDEVRLLKKRELRQMFPTSVLHAERLGGLVKSWVVYGGFSTN